MIFLDCETTGLDPRADRLVLVGIAGSRGDPRVLRHPEDRELIQRVLDLETTFAAHNCTFDMSFLEHAGYRLPPPSAWTDTQLIAHVGGERMPGQTALRRLTQRLIELEQLPADTLEPEDAIKAWLSTARRAARKQDLRRPELGDAPAHLLEPYLKADVRCTRTVAHYYGSHINGQAEVLELERRCLPAIYAAQQRGVPLDLDAAHELRDRTTVTVADLRARLFELAGHPFNLNAARQIETALSERGVDLSGVPRTPKAGLPMFTAQTLQAIDDELARDLLAYREEKKLADYVADLYRHTHGDRLFGSFKLTGTQTGRMSSSGPNLQNIPKSDLRIRYVIAAGEGRQLVRCDLDNVELRVMACYAPGGALERAFARGVDVHQQTADSVGVSRDLGKKLNYAVVYGGGAPLFAKTLGVSEQEGAAFLRRWSNLYPEVRELRQRLSRTVRRRGYLETIGGRRHYFDEPNHMLLNRLVSGGCADLFKRSVTALHAAGVELVLIIHDELVAEAAEDDVVRVSRALETELARPARRKGAHIDGLVAEAASAKRWAWFKDPSWEPGREVST